MQYWCGGFVERNLDTLGAEVGQLLATSGEPLLRALFRDHSADNAPVPTPRRRANTLGSAFKHQLNALMSRISATRTHFVRCINPNQHKQPDAFDPSYVATQLRSAGASFTLFASHAPPTRRGTSCPSSGASLAYASDHTVVRRRRQRRRSCGKRYEPSCRPRSQAVRKVRRRGLGGGRTCEASGSAEVHEAVRAWPHSGLPACRGPRWPCRRLWPLPSSMCAPHAGNRTRTHRAARALRTREAAAVRMQANARRMLVSRARRTEKTRHYAAMTIQASARRSACYQDYKATRATRRLATQRNRSIVAIQTAARGRAARKALGVRREEARSVAGLQAKLDAMQSALLTERARAEAERVERVQTEFRLSCLQGQLEEVEAEAEKKAAEAQKKTSGREAARVAAVGSAAVAASEAVASMSAYGRGSIDPMGNVVGGAALPMDPSPRRSSIMRGGASRPSLQLAHLSELRGERRRLQQAHAKQSSHSSVEPVLLTARSTYSDGGSLGGVERGLRSRRARSMPGPPMVGVQQRTVAPLPT